MTIMLDKIRKKIQEGQIVTGYTATSSDPAICELIGLAGCDYVWFEAEHGALGLTELQRMMIGARAGGAASFVRVVDKDPRFTRPILDMGPDAIIFPFINTPEDARDAIAASTYPPDGVRGFNPQRASNYGQISYSDFPDSAANDIWRVMIIERKEGIQNIERIAQVEGVDALVMGPGDLSLDMGLAGELDHPDIEAALRHAAAVCRRYGKPFVVYPWDSLKEMKMWLGEGASIFNFGYDFPDLSKVLANRLSILRQAVEETE